LKGGITMLKRTLIAAALAVPLVAMADVYTVETGVSTAYAPVLQFGPVMKFDTPTQVVAVHPVGMPPSAVVVDPVATVTTPATVVSEPVAVVTEPTTITTEPVVIGRVTEDEATGLTPEAKIEPLASSDQDELVKTSG
jgi:hypothetical protein